MDSLRAARSMALRKRIWYRVLDRVERGIVDLTIRFVDSVKSRILAGQLDNILAKLMDAAKSAFTRYVEGYGVAKMREVVCTAIGLGSEAAVGWLSPGFAMWFALNDMHNPVGWRYGSE